MAPSFVSLGSRSKLLSVLLLLAAMQGQLARSQSSCPSRLASLNVCGPFVVPGAGNASPDASCCAALRSLDRDCICNTLNIASRLPVQCNLPPLNCSPN